MGSASGVEASAVVVASQCEVVRAVAPELFVALNEDVKCLVKRAVPRFSDRLEGEDDPVFQDVAVNALGQLFHGSVSVPPEDWRRSPCAVGTRQRTVGRATGRISYCCRAASPSMLSWGGS